MRGIGCRPAVLSCLARFRERPAVNAGMAAGKALRMGPRGCRLSGDGCTGPSPGLEGQVTTATPLAPQGAWPGRPSGNRS